MTNVFNITKLYLRSIIIKIFLSKLKHFREFSRGDLDMGTGIAMLMIILIVAFSAMLVGSILPLMKNKSNQPVLVKSVIPQEPKGNIQLYTFIGITLTPTPTAYILPQPQESGGFNYGTPPSSGGSSAPSGGGGGGGGGGSAI